MLQAYSHFYPPSSQQGVPCGAPSQTIAHCCAPLPTFPAKKFITQKRSMLLTNLMYLWAKSIFIGLPCRSLGEGRCPSVVNQHAKHIRKNIDFSRPRFAFREI
jgi:hypothetical protein